MYHQARDESNGDPKAIRSKDRWKRTDSMTGRKDFLKMCVQYLIIFEMVLRTVSGNIALYLAQHALFVLFKTMV
jgi:hypothetical protein